jgi:hypothetical protein
VHAERTSNARCDRLNNARRVENDGNGDRQHDELHEANDLAREEKEDRDYTDDPEKNRPEKSLQIRN